MDYLEDLGISDLYFSPLFRSREESSHGYDVVSHTTIEPTFGTASDFHRLVDEVRARDMGILLDVVPNHMGINDPANEWWLDVLENGPLSRYAGYFDIDWDRPAESLKDTLLLPFLGDYFGAVLERGELQIKYEGDRLQLAYGPLRFPLAFATWPTVLEPALDHLRGTNADKEAIIELESIITQLKNLPGRERTDPLAMDQRYREQQVAGRRVRSLTKQFPAVGKSLDYATQELNGTPGDRQSFDRLEALLNAQWYRLAYWHVAADEINYRRFFDINDLAAIRVELPEVFSRVHALVFDLLCADRITGLRIDHPDGLYDPQEYFEKLQQLYRGCCKQQGSSTSTDERLYVVVEKILTGNEELPRQWPVAGTTGYEVLSSINHLLVDEEGLKSVVAAYEHFIGRTEAPSDVIYESKKHILHDSMSSELQMLAARLYRIAQQSRMSRDFTVPSLLRALREVIACFPVYRSYIRSQGWDVDADDEGRIRLAVRTAKRRNPTMNRSVVEFVSSVLLLEFPPALEKSQQEQWREFALRFQQVTGPVTAKGVEDTSFYRYFPLVSLNEVGGELGPTACSTDAFHALMQRRFADWPHSLSATATHDTKRGEDTRARINVLSQVPDEWADFANRWNERCTPLLREIDGQVAPSLPERYLLLQTLVATWPMGDVSRAERDEYQGRIRQFIAKALREAKVNTSWLNPSPEYESAVMDFVSDLLNPQLSQDVFAETDQFARLVVDAGYVNSLSQVVLKACIPGVPDFYQGTELWDFNLVDPDNRRPVNYEERRNALADIKGQFEINPAAFNETLARQWPDPRTKLFVTWRLLQLRRQSRDLFAFGDYRPLEIHGIYCQNAIAFARTKDTASVVVVVARNVQQLLATDNDTPTTPGATIGGIDWNDTSIHLPDDLGCGFENVFTQAKVKACNPERERSRSILLSEILNPWPIAVLTSNASKENS